MPTKTKKKTENKGFKKLSRQGMVATPESTKFLGEYISRFSGSEAVVAFTCAGMAWNLACKLQEENIKNGWIKEGWDKD